jgi:hypothetical protein
MGSSWGRFAFRARAASARGTMFGYESQHLARLGVAFQVALLEYRHAVHRHLETSAAGRVQPDVGVGIVLPDRGRQTDGPRFVVSGRAVFDQDLHVRSGFRSD